MASDPENAPKIAPKTYIRGSDDLDYKNLTAKLLGEPAKTPRNEWVAYVSRYTKNLGFRAYLIKQVPDAKARRKEVDPHYEALDFYRTEYDNECERLAPND